MSIAGKASVRSFTILLAAAAALACAQAGLARAAFTLDPGLEGLPPGVWSQSSALGRSIIVEAGTPGAVAPHSGSFLAWLGGANHEYSELWQTVAIPADAGSGTLSWYQWLVTDDDPGFDFAYIKINGTNVNVQDLAAQINPGDWLQRSVPVDLQPYAGSSIELRFVADTDGALVSSFFLDDITLDVANGVPSGIPGDVPDDVPGGTPGDIPGGIPGGIPSGVATIPAPPAAGLVLLGLCLLRGRRTAARRTGGAQ
jgi:hypothetical protein